MYVTLLQTITSPLYSVHTSTSPIRVGDSPAIQLLKVPYVPYSRGLHEAWLQHRSHFTHNESVLSWASGQSGRHGVTLAPPKWLRGSLLLAAPNVDTQRLLLRQARDHYRKDLWMQAIEVQLKKLNDNNKQMETSPETDG